MVKPANLCINDREFVISSAVAFTGASVRLEPAATRRMGNTLLVIAAYMWTATIVHLVRLWAENSPR